MVYLGRGSPGSAWAMESGVYLGRRRWLVAAEGDHGVDLGGALCGEPGGEQGHHDDDGNCCDAGGGIDCAQTVQLLANDAGCDQGEGNADDDAEREQQ